MASPTALLLSPHLDDAAFSCGGLAALLADRGWRVVIATAFTRSIHPATGFALACQLDKGLSPEVDYMALRREEDLAAAAALGAEVRWLDLPEAPHRGYSSAPALFAGPHPDDAAWRDLAARLRPLLDALDPALILAPQGLGGHVDHLQAIRAARACCPEPRLAWYRDTPYAIRDPQARPGPEFDGLHDAALPIPAALGRKLDAACAYRSQIGFQFGGEARTRDALRAFAEREGGGIAAERLLLRDPALLRLDAARGAT